MKKSRITDEQIIGLQKQARLPDAVAPMQGDPAAAPRRSPAPRFPDRQPRRPPRASIGPVSDSPMVSRFRAKIAPDSPRVMPETRMQFKKLEVVARDGIEPSTRGFSIRCSTN